jgi:5-methylcytosine-specific restriction endonuclease McrA
MQRSVLSDSRKKIVQHDSDKRPARDTSRSIRSRCDSLRGLSDKDLLARLTGLCGTEREVQLKILIHLIEVDRRRLYLSMGYGSLFEFSTGYLKYSNSAAGRRIRAARCIGRFPRVADMFRTGELNLTAIAMISGILNNNNAGEILDWVKGRPFRDVEMLVSRHRPERYLRDRVRPVCIMTENTRTDVHPESAGCMTSSGGASTAAAADAAGSTHKDTNIGFVNAPSGVNTTNAAPGSKCKASLTFTPNIGSEKFPRIHNAHGEKNLEGVEIKQKFQLQFAVEPDFMETLKRVTSLLSTMYPQGLTFEMVFTILMKYYLDRHDPGNRINRRDEIKKRAAGHRKKHAPQNTGATVESSDTGNRRTAGRNQCYQAGTAAQEPREEKASGNEQRGSENTRHAQRSEREKISARVGERCKSQSRQIPQSVRDEVFTRDGGRCTFVGDDGVRCNSTWNLEIDHIRPYAKGGGNTPNNLRLLCARHNRLMAERQFGKDHMERYYRRE